MDETKRKKPFKHRRYLKPLVGPQYIVKCRGCGKRLRDPADKPIYISQLDEYWHSQRCLNRHDPVRREVYGVNDYLDRGGV